MNIATRVRVIAWTIWGGFWRLFRRAFDKGYRHQWREYRAALYLAERGFVIIPTDEIRKLMANADHLATALSNVDLPDNRTSRQLERRATHVHRSAIRILEIMEHVIVFGGGPARW